MGIKIMQGAAEHIKPVTLELGGNSPVVVCPDADIQQAAEGAHFALFFNIGALMESRLQSTCLEPLQDMCGGRWAGRWHGCLALCPDRRLLFPDPVPSFNPPAREASGAIGPYVGNRWASCRPS